MFLDRRQIELIKQAIEDYKFMKEELEAKINKDYTMEELTNFISKFKGTEITSVEDYNTDYAYLDFNYNAVNMFVQWDKEIDNKLKVSSTFEIYDRTICSYVIEDFLTVEEYQKLINTPKESMLRDIIADLKWYDSNNKQEQYQDCVDKIIHFLKEEF